MRPRVPRKLQIQHPIHTLDMTHELIRSPDDQRYRLGEAARLQKVCDYAVPTAKGARSLASPPPLFLTKMLDPPSTFRPMGKIQVLLHVSLFCTRHRCFSFRYREDNPRITLDGSIRNRFMSTRFIPVKP